MLKPYEMNHHLTCSRREDLQRYSVKVICSLALLAVGVALWPTISDSYMNLTAHGGGLVGPPRDPRLGTECGSNVIDYSWERDLESLRYATAIVFIPIAWIPLNKSKSIRRVWLELLALSAIPISFWMFGYILIANFTGWQAE